MAVTSTSNFSDYLVNVFDRSKFVPFERALTKFLDGIEDSPDKPAYGSGLKFPIFYGDPHSAAAAAEGSSFPDINQQGLKQGTVTPISVVGAMGLTEQLIARGVNDGTFGVKVLVQYVTASMRNLLSCVNRLTLGHGTGRMAVVESSSSGASVTCRLPESVFQLRDNMTIDFYDTDTGGTKQGITETIQPGGINLQTRVITLGNSHSVTAGWGIYKALTSSVSSYGVATNGLRGIVDDGTLQATIFSLSRSSYPFLNATVYDSSPALQTFSEALVFKAITAVRMKSDGVEPEEIWCNEGIIGEYLKNTVPDRRFNVPVGSSEVPNYRIGYKPEELAFTSGGKNLPFKVDRDLPAREFYVITKSLFRKSITKKAGWVGDNTEESGSTTPILLQAPSTTTYSFNKLAGLMWDGNIYHAQPKLNTKVASVSDSALAGD